MENFIPFLIGIALFIYKTWTNYQKEQEKSRKRNPAKPPVAKGQNLPDVRYNKTPASGKKPDPFLLEETLDTNNPYEPRYKHLYQKEAVPEKYQEEKSREFASKELRPYQEGRNPEQVSEEVQTNRKIHQPHKHKKVELHEEEAAFKFDIRDAVIKEAILNRPKF